MATIDFAAILAGDPVYQNALKSIAATKLADYTDLNNSRYADLIRFGEVPIDPVTGSPWSPTDPETQQPIGIPPTVLDNILASTRSGFSTVAGINNAYQTAISQLKGNLGERNMFRSGDYAYGLNKGLRAEQLGRAGAQDTLFTGAGGLNDLVRNYLSQVHGLAGDQQTAAMDAFQRAVAQINAGLGSTSDTPGAGTDTGDGSTTNPPVPLAPIGVGTVDPNGGLYIGDYPGDVPNTGYSPVDPNNPGITYTPDYYGDTGSYEPKTTTDSPAYADVGQDYTSPAVPDLPSPIYLQQYPSDAGGRAASNPYAAPTPPGYGGGSTAGQVRRNSY